MVRRSKPLIVNYVFVHYVDGGELKRINNYCKESSIVLDNDEESDKESMN